MILDALHGRYRCLCSATIFRDWRMFSRGLELLRGFSIFERQIREHGFGTFMDFDGRTAHRRACPPPLRSPPIQRRVLRMFLRRLRHHGKSRCFDRIKHPPSSSPSSPLSATPSTSPHNTSEDAPSRPPSPSASPPTPSSSPPTPSTPPSYPPAAQTDVSTTPSHSPSPPAP